MAVPDRVSLTWLETAPDDDFVAALDGIFEDSPWVARRSAGARPVGDLAGLHRTLVATVEAAPASDQLALIRAHPDLAGRAAVAGELSEASTAEQAGAGLDRLAPDEFARFTSLNRRYRERFGFPFVIAVAGLSKHGILAAFEARLDNDADAERREALRQIARIARLRLDARIVDDTTDRT